MNKIIDKISNRKINIACFAIICLIASIVMMGASEKKGKSGSIDFERVLRESKYGKQKLNELTQQSKSRDELLKFVSMYRSMSSNQAGELRSLILKVSRTPEEEAKLKSLKEKVIDEDTARLQLLQKKDRTPEEQKSISEYSRRIKQNEKTLPQWSREFTEELYRIRQSGIQESVKAAKDALEKVAAKEGYTKVFDSKVLPYSSNDLTNETIKELDNNKK